MVITVWSKGSGPRQNQGVPAGPRCSKSTGMFEAWVCSASGQEGAVWCSGGTGLGPQAGEVFWGGRARQWLKRLRLRERKRERGEKGRERERRDCPTLQKLEKSQPKPTPPHVGNWCPHRLTVHPSPPWTVARKGRAPGTSPHLPCSQTHCWLVQAPTTCPDVPPTTSCPVGAVTEALSLWLASSQANTGPTGQLPPYHSKAHLTLPST